MTKPKAAPVFEVAVNLPAQVPEIIKKGRQVVQLMGPPNPWFTNPAPSAPTLAVFSADLDGLEAAETTAANKAPGAVATRNAKLRTIEKDFKHTASFVEQVADANAGNEEVIIKSAGFDVKAKGGHAPSVFRVEDSTVSGEVVLHAPQLPGTVSHYWQGSTDGKTFTSYPETAKGTAVIPNLTPGTLYYFRHRRLTRKGMTDWDQTVSMMVT